MSHGTEGKQTTHTGETQDILQDESSSEDVMDLTNCHLHNLSDNVVIPKHVRHLDLTANRLKDIEPCILELEHLETLSFRQNLLKDASKISLLQSAEKMTSLELRDNQLEQVPDLSRFQKLEYLELSYNMLRNIGGLHNMANSILGNGHPLRELYLANNKIKVIEGLETFARHLEQLELGSNRIKSMQGLESLSHISLQSNRLTSMQGLEECEALEEIYVSDNGITELCPLEKFRNLKVLDVSHNRLQNVAGVRHLPQITDLWANNNLINNLDDVEQELEATKDTLQVLYLNGNPFLESQGQSYRLRMTHTLPNLEQLDDVLVQH